MSLAAFLLVHAVAFLLVAIICAVVGVFAPANQGLAEIMFWFTAVALAMAAGFVFALIGQRDESL